MTSSRLEASIVAMLLLVGCIALGLLVESDPRYLSYATNSDTLFAVSYVWDVKNHSYAWAGHQLPRIPSLFPDIAGYALFELLFDNFRWSLIGYALLQSTAFVVLAGCVIASLTYARVLHSALVLLSVLTVVMLCNRLGPRFDHLFTMFMTLHFGSFLMSIAVVLLALRLIEQWTASRAILFTLCVLVAYLSNMKFMFDFIVPMIAAGLALILSGLMSWRRGTGLFLCTAVGALGGWELDRWLVRGTNMEIDDVAHHVQRFFEEMPGYLAGRPLVTLAVVVIPWTVSAAMVLVWLRRRCRHGMRPVLTAGDRAALFIGTFAVTAAIGSVASLAVVYVDQFSLRYAAPGTFWPLIFVAAAMAPLLQRWVVPLALGQIAMASTAIVALAGWSGFVPRMLHWQHPLASCLQARRAELGLKAGLADYWLSRAPTVSSNFTLQIDQVWSNGTPMYWVNDRFWYYKSFADPTRPPEYNFIVLTRLDLESVRERFGPPARTAECSGHTVWIYDDTVAFYRNLDPKL